MNTLPNKGNPLYSEVIANDGEMLDLKMHTNPKSRSVIVLAACPNEVF